jgi:hypothetical protein
MKTLLVPCLAALMTLCPSGPMAASGSSPDRLPPQGPIYVDTADILYLESFPVQVQLHVIGSLPTPCHSPVWQVTPGLDHIDVALWSEAQAEGLCSTVLEPFEVSIPLGSFETASLSVNLNGEIVGRVEVGVPPGPESDSLLGAGWSFGMCMGYCNADLVISSDGSLILTASDRAGNVVLFSNPGSLTDTGHERIAAEVAELAGVPLQEVYGCPDCADGGAAYLALSRNGAASHHAMGFGEPPAELADLYDVAMTIMGALEACVSNELVTVADDCEVWQQAA